MYVPLPTKSALFHALSTLHDCRPRWPLSHTFHHEQGELIRIINERERQEIARLTETVERYRHQVGYMCVSHQKT